MFDVMDYIKNYLKNEENQRYMEEQALMLLTKHFKDKNDYQKEKFLKIFGEGIMYYESKELYNLGIHPNQYKDLTPEKHIFLKMNYIKYNKIVNNKVRAFIDERVSRFANIFENKIENSLMNLKEILEEDLIFLKNNLKRNESRTEEEIARIIESETRRGERLILIFI